MKTDKLLHLVQQKKAMRSGGALPLPKAQTGVPKQNPYLPNTPLATGATETTYSPIDVAIAAMTGVGLVPSVVKLSKSILRAQPQDRGWMNNMIPFWQAYTTNMTRETYEKARDMYENANKKQNGGLAKAQDGLEPLVAEYKDLQDKINKGYGKESDYVKKLKQVSDKLIKEQFALETSGKVPESILNWKDPKTGDPAAFCIGTACYLANEAGDPFSYYSNTEAQQAAMRPESTRYLEQSEKYIEPGDIIQYKKGDSEKRRPSHAYTVLDIGEPDDRGFKPITVVGSGGHGPIHYRDYYLGPDNKIYGSPSNQTPMATQLLKRKSSGSREYDQIVSKRDELKKAIEAIQPDYFNPKPTVRSGDFLPTDFMFNKSGWYGGNPENYSFDLPDRDRTYALGPSGENRVAEQIYPKDAKLPEILSQISNPAYKQTFMEKHNISSREYDAIAKTMLGIYGAESKFGTDYWGTGKLPEPQGISKLLGFGSVGPFQINRKSLSKDLREKYNNKDLHDPIKASEATMEFLAEGLTPKGMNLRRRAKLDKDSERYMQNVNPENYLEYLSYLHNQPKWLTGDKSTMRTEGDIVAGEHPYKKLVDYYSGLFDVLPSSIAAPVEVVGERPAYEWKQKGGLAKAQYGLNTGFITYSQNPEYFNSKAVLSDNPEWNDKLKQLIYQGKAAYNPNTGAIQFIDSPAAPVDIQQMGTRDYTEGVRRDPTNPAYAGADDRTRQIIEQSTQEAYQNPLMYAPGTIGMTMLPVGFGMGYGLSQSAAQAGQGNYGAAALTAGLSTLPILPKFYKVLPEGTFAGYSKLQNPNKSYRVARMDAFDDFVESGVLRSRTPPSKPGMSFGEKMKLRSTGFPSFQKGYADFYYLRNKPGVVFETSLPTFKRGEINPVTGMRIKGSHYAHRVIDPETGNVLSSIPSEYISVYNAKPNWLKGFKKIDIPRTTIQQSNQKKNGGLAKAQYGWMTPPSLAPVAREVMKDEIVQPMPITGYQNLVNLSNKKRQEILNAYQLNNAFKDLSGETIELTADRYKGAKVPVEYITKMYDTAIEHGIDPYKLFALAGRESTFGSGFDAASKARKDSALNLVSGWNLAEDFLPYGVDRFLADRKVPGVKVYKGNKGWSYQVTDPKAVDKYLKENPRAYGQYMETLSSLPALGDQDAFDLASEFIKTKNISRYNPGDPDYANKIKQDYEILKRDPAFKKYVDSLRRRPTKQAAGGLTKAQNGLQYVPNGTYGNYYDPATQQYIPQVYLPDVDIVADRELPFQNGKFAPFLASRGIAEYVPAESIFLPGTPIVKGLGKVGNVLLDAVNPLAGMRGLKGARNVSKFEPIHSYDYYIAKQNRDNAYKRLQDLQNEMSTKVSVEKKSLEDITADIDDLNKSIKPRSEATTDDLQTLLNRFQNINKDLEKYIPKYKLLDSKAKNYDSKLATMLYEGNIPLSKQFPTRTLYNIQSGSSPIWKVNQDVNDYIQQLQFGKPKLEKPYYDFQLLRSVQNNLADEKLSEELIREQLLQEPLSKTVDYLGTPITFSPRASEYRLKMKDYPNRFTGIDAWRLGLNPNKDGGSTKSKLKKKVKINKPR